MATKDSILIVDDEKGIQKSLVGIFSDEGCEAHAVGSGEEALERLRERDYDAVILDVWLPGIGGIEVLERLKKESYPGAIVMISGHANIEMAVAATKMGAYDFIEKPPSLEKTLLAVRNAIAHARLAREHRKLRERYVERPMVGRSAALEKLSAEIERAASAAANVLVTGESGSGKELVARLLHGRSARRDKPFIEVNCAAIPEELIESELFGHVKGAFTGALANREGKFEAADSGTLFLDEVGDMSLPTQAKVLRVIEERRFTRVGGNAPLDVDVRVIAATNKNLLGEIKQGRFREDLYFRLHVISLHVPPLRERAEDIPLLARHFMETFADEYGRAPKVFSPEAMERLKSHDWPGNVRELRNTIERAFIMSAGTIVERDDFPALVRGADAAPSESLGALMSTVGDGVPLRKARAEFEKALIASRLAACGGSVARAATSLGIERSHLHRKIRAYGIAVEES